MATERSEGGSNPDRQEREMINRLVEDAARTQGSAPQGPSEEALTLSVPATARLLGISRALAYDLVRTGDIPAIRLGRRIVVPRRALELLLDDAAQAS